MEDKIICAMDVAVPADSKCYHCCVYCDDLNCDCRCPICKETFDENLVLEFGCTNAIF